LYQVSRTAILKVSLDTDLARRGTASKFSLPYPVEARLTAREEIVEIASDKFGTHVLCKAVGLRELEVCPSLPPFPIMI
jgi:hypothetical protein